MALITSKKATSLISKTTIKKILHVHHAFLYISLPFLHDFGVKMPNLTFYGGRKQAPTKFYSSFLDMVLRDSTPEGVTYIWQSKWVRIVAMKTERVQVKFLWRRFRRRHILGCLSLYKQTPPQPLFGGHLYPGDTFLGPKGIVSPKQRFQCTTYRTPKPTFLPRFSWHPKCITEAGYNLF